MLVEHKMPADQGAAEGALRLKSEGATMMRPETPPLETFKTPESLFCRFEGCQGEAFR
jgi:hypothetical protein